ncbi:MAG: hypothetical protein ACU84Q_01495 [Gammaproteobacteria bacterium]
MNWDIVAACGEIIGAGAVVISVFYLAFQVKKQTEESKLSASRELAALYHDLLGDVQNDKEFSELYLKAVQNYDELPNSERIRVALLFQRGFRILEQQYLHTGKSQVDPVFFESIRLTFIEWLTFPGVQQWWMKSSGFFAREFSHHVDQMMAQAEQKGYESTFKHSNDITN